MTDAGRSKTVYRMIYWAALVAVGLALGLALRKSPPPSVTYDPAAPARVEQKFAAADQSKAAGQPAAVQLDSTELNSYLQQNLQIAGSPASAAAPAATAPGAVPTPAPSGLPDDGTATLEQVQSSVKDVKVDMDGDLVKA